MEHFLLCITYVTGLPVSKVDFPSVVICAQGFNMETLLAAYYNQILGAWKNMTGGSTDKSPIQFSKAQLLYRQNTVRNVNFTIHCCCIRLIIIFEF